MSQSVHWRISYLLIVNCAGSRVETQNSESRFSPLATRRGE